ncbi:MAG: hypothetical protein ACYTGH_08750, partial [Planctomycetota bacterium]
MRLGLFHLLLFSFALVPMGNATPHSRPSSLAILDLKSPTSTPWLGTAVAEAVRVKLSGVDGIRLVEREAMKPLLTAKSEGKPSPEMIGAEYLLTGTVQLIGDWGAPDAKLRITAKVLCSQSAILHGDRAIIVDAAVSDLFTVETELAERLCKAVASSPGKAQLTYREAHSLTAKQAFAEGLQFSLLAKRGQTGSQALLHKAIQRFRQAQRENEGHFYAQAHHYETEAREKLAAFQNDASAAAAMRETTIKQFREDAANAAPALFDLGR